MSISSMDMLRLVVAVLSRPCVGAEAGHNAVDTKATWSPWSTHRGETQGEVAFELCHEQW